MKKYNWRLAGIWLPVLLFLSACGTTESGKEEYTALLINPAGNEEQNASDGERNSDAESVKADTDGETPVAEHTQGSMTVTFLDVGQGNAVLVESGGAYMLIDGGDRDYSSFVVSYLKSVGVEELDYVISSHYDADHLNGVVGVLNAFPCDMVLASDYTTDTKVYKSFCDVITEKDIELCYPSVGDTYALGEAEITVVCPDNYEYSDVNDNSVGVRIEHGENSFLLCGDAGEKSEKAMLESGVVLDSDVYLANHHGSDGSSSWEFLQAVSPETVIFSVGADNSYGHPTARVLSDVETLGAEIYRTDRQGTIVVTSDGEKLSWDMEALTEVLTTDGQPAADTQEGSAAAEEVQSVEQTYILNRNTKKFHNPSCSSAEDIAVENRAEFTGTREELIDAGFDACKRCNP